MLTESKSYMSVESGHISIPASNTLRRWVIADEFVEALLVTAPEGIEGQGRSAASAITNDGQSTY
jgi:hypothetical protein